MIRDLYRLKLTAWPGAGSRALLLDLDDWRQEALDLFVAEILTDRQWRNIDDGILRALAKDLTEEAEQHLEKGT
jgi:hypothetical protein